MFASALQKRKAAVALSQTPAHPPPAQAAQQAFRPSYQQQQQQQQQATPAARQAASASSSNASANSSATDAQPQLLSAMLAKKQRMEPSASSSFVNARQLNSSSQSQQEKPAASAVKRRASSAKQNARSQQQQQQQQQDDAQEGIVFELSAKRRVTVRKWRAAVLVDIREYYDDDGVSKPGKKGISLAKEQWRALQRLSPAIDEAIILVQDDNVDEHSLQDVKERISADSKERTISFSLSSKRRISVRFFRSGVLVDLREFYDQDGVQKPGKKGISLSKEQWRALCGAQQEVSEAASQL